MILYILIGFAAGVISGMGIGGGVILIPAIILVTGIEQQVAQGINLLYFLPIATVAIILHIRSHNMVKEVLLPLIIGGLLGAALGSWAANHIDPQILRRIFGGFLLFMGIREVFTKKNKAK